jgi:hypothetical protein
MSGNRAVAVTAPPDGCWVALACDLRVETLPPNLPGPTPPVVRTASALDVIAIEPGDAPGRWTIRTIAFEPGTAALPRLAVEIVDASGRRRFADTAAQSVTVQQRSWPDDAALAGLERLAPLANPLWWPSVLAASFALGTLGLCASRLAHRGGAWFDRVVEPWRLRFAAARLLRRVTAGDGRRVYDRIVVAMRLVLALRAGRSLSAFTANELMTLTGRLDLVPADRRRLAGLLTKSDAVRFGRRVPPAAVVAADLAVARRLVTSSRLVRRPART